MSPEGRVQVVVRGRKVPVGTILVTEPVYATFGIRVGTKATRRVLYDTVYGDEHRRAVEEAQKLAHSLGMGLEVVDESRLGPLARIRFVLGRGGSRYPSVVVTPSTGMMTSHTPSPLTKGH